MPWRSCFSDLNVLVHKDKKINGDTLRFLADFGYERVALNHEIELAKKVQVKEAPDITTVVDNIPTSKGHRHPLQLLQRLTVSVDDSSVLHALSSPSLDSYDILAISPGNDKVFQQACSVLNVDIISLRLDERLPFKMKFAQVGLAIERGISFEICYAPAIRDVTARRNTLANAMDLVQITKGKNIIVSSGAEKAMETRGPADVTNLCHLFNLTGGTAKSCITTHCRSALLHSDMRRKTAKGVVSCEVLSMVEREEEEEEGNDSVEHLKTGSGTVKRRKSSEKKNKKKKN